MDRATQTVKLIWYNKNAIKVVVKFKNSPQNATWNKILKDFFTNSNNIGTNQEISLAPVFVINQSIERIVVHIVSNIAGIFLKFIN